MFNSAIMILMFSRKFVVTVGTSLVNFSRAYLLWRITGAFGSGSVGSSTKSFRSSPLDAIFSIATVGSIFCSACAAAILNSE